MIRKTQKIYKRHVKEFPRARCATLTERVLKETWWFLFVPIYSRETTLESYR